MPWEWFATAKATSQVSLCTSGWFLGEIISSSQDRLWYILRLILPPAGGCVYCAHSWSVSKQPFPDSVFPPYSFSGVGMWLNVFCVCPSGNEVIGVDSAEVRASVQYLHIIDNQQTLFELSHKLEPRAWKHWSTCHRRLDATCHTFASSPSQQRCPMDCKVPNVLYFWENETLMSALEEILHIKRGLAKLGGEEAVSSLYSS